MIMEMAGKNNPFTEDNVLDDLEAFLTDGRLTEPSDGKSYRLRDAIKRVEELGRPLTPEELEEFEIK